MNAMRRILPFLLLVGLMAAGCDAGDWTVAERKLIENPSEVMRVLTLEDASDAAVLRKQSRDLPPAALADPLYAELADKLVATVTSPEQDGVGIAGPQVGVLRRIVAVQRFDKEGEPFEVYPNIRITATRGALEPGAEGCLSVPGRRGTVLRYRDIDIRYTSPATGRDTTERVEGFTAVIFQHETDHLDGVLYIDKLDTGPDQTAVRPASYAGNQPRFKALLYYSDQVEEAHRQFARQAMEFFHRLTYGEGWILDMSTSLADRGDLNQYSLIIMPNAAPGTPQERSLFEEYMENGGGWLGFHGAGYNDASTGWDWFRDFLGGVRFLCNNWPPQPALVDIEGHDHDITRNLPDQYVAPATEFYQWQPELRANPDVRILASLSPRNFPLGIKDIVFGGDFPVVWTNTQYRMVYINMGHGDECFSDATQNLLFVNALRFVAASSPEGNPFER